MEDAKQRLKVYCETSFWSLAMEIDMNAYDPIMEEIYAVRRRISARYGHDIHRYIEAMRAKQREEEAKGRKYVRLPIARVAPAKAMSWTDLTNS